MNMKTNEELSVLIGKATAGDKESLETIITSIQDLVFNLPRRRGRVPGYSPENHNASVVV